MVYCTECFDDIHKVMSNAHVPIQIFKVKILKKLKKSNYLIICKINNFCIFFVN